METVILIAAALLPAILLFIYVWKQDTKKEPFLQLFKAVFYGVLICVPIAFLELYITKLLQGVGLDNTTLLGTTADAFLVAALPEETAKLLALWLIVRKNKYFDEHYDGIVYAVCVGLGFAAFENLFYVLADDGGIMVAVMRALLAVPGHYAFAVIMGYCYSVYHFVKPSFGNAIMILLMPVMAHGIYDALALSGTADPTVGGIAFFVLIYFVAKLQKIAKRRIEKLVANDKILFSNIDE